MTAAAMAGGFMIYSHLPKYTACHDVSVIQIFVSMRSPGFSLSRQRKIFVSGIVAKETSSKTKYNQLYICINDTSAKNVKRNDTGKHL
jgi:hypothetical protein